MGHICQETLEPVSWKLGCFWWKELAGIKPAEWWLKDKRVTSEQKIFTQRDFLNNHHSLRSDLWISLEGSKKMLFVVWLSLSISYHPSHLFLFTLALTYFFFSTHLESNPLACTPGHNPWHSSTLSGRLKGSWHYTDPFLTQLGLNQKLLLKWASIN